MDTQDLTQLFGTVPFSFLPEGEMESLSNRIGIESHKKDTILFVQGTSVVDRLSVIKSGSAERFFDEGNKRILRGKLGEGDIYGGISILLNNRVSIRTLRIIEDSVFYTLGADDFLDLCDRFQPFKDYFTNTFGQRMQDRAYAGILARQIRDEEQPIPFFNKPLNGIARKDLVSCPSETTIREAARQMTRNDISSIFVMEPGGSIDGILTDNDLRKRVVATGLDTGKPAREVMTTPLVSLPLNSQVVDAFMMMTNENIKHLPLTDPQGGICAVVTDNDLMAAQGDSPYMIIREIRLATSIKQIVRIHERLPGIMLALIQSGAKAENLSKLITAVSDAILQKVIQFAINSAGRPPCRFAFIIMGSEGRSEQTLKTDQDNAIIYETISYEGEHARIRDYFLKLANLICTWLDQAGFAFCEGNNMAKNPKWCQPVDVWKGYFFDWIHKASPEDLLHASIFFDFKGAWGNMELVDELKNFLFKSLQGWSGFFRNLTENALYFKPPIGFFRNILVESEGEYKDSFDIKRAMQPIVDFARIYALKNGIRQTNTLDRLDRVFQKNVLNQDEYKDVVLSYQYLLQLRLFRQVTAITEENRPPDNYCNPKNLSRLDQTMLKEIFKRTEKLQLKLGIEFTGVI